MRVPTTQRKYIDAVNNGLRSTTREDCPSNASKRIINILTSAAIDILPAKPKSEKNCELWKNDECLNELLNEREKLSLTSSSYKDTTKKIKKRVTWLRNKKLRLEAEEINDHANKRQIEELFRSFKADGSTFRNTHHKLDVTLSNSSSTSRTISTTRLLMMNHWS